MEANMNCWDIKREMAIPIWEDRIKACRASGMSIDQWCAENDISRKTYYRWEKLCIARALQSRQGSAAEARNENAMIKIDPMMLSNKKEVSDYPIFTAPAELVIHCGCVSLDISPQMPVARIAKLVSALNSHV